MYNDNEKIRIQRLPNGALLLTDEVPGIESVAFGVWADAGSVDELPAEYGLAHFLEHMFFKGTEKRNAYELAESIENVGGQINAYTERETTHLYARVLAEHLPVAVDLMADMVCHSAFAQAEFDRERQVVFEEIHKYESLPDERIHDLMMESLWRGGALGHSILGTIDSVRGFTRAGLVSCWQRFFSAERVLITVAGKFDYDALLAMVTEAFASLPTQPAPIAKFTAGERAPYLLSEEDEEQVHFSWGGRSYAAADDRNFALAVVDATLGGSTTSRLFQEIREKRGLAYDVSSFTLGFRETGLVCADGATSLETFPEVLELVQREIKTMLRAGISEKELARAKEQMKAGMALALESSLDRMRRLAMHQLTWGTVYSVRYLIDRLNQVTLDDAMRVIHEVLDLDQWSLAVIGPVGEAEVKTLLGGR